MRHQIFERGVDPMSTPVLVLHGWPGVRSKQNRDIAERINAECARNSILALYDGLGPDGGTLTSDRIFHFDQCFADVRALAEELLARHARLDVVGHSLGGFFALNLAALYPGRVRHVILMSPLLHFFSREETRPYFEDIVRNRPQLKIPPLDVLLDEFMRLEPQWGIESRVDRLPRDLALSLLQAQNDSVTPDAFAVAFAQTASAVLREPVYFESVETDHSFVENRESAIAKILARVRAYAE